MMPPESQLGRREEFCSTQLCLPRSKRRRASNSPTVRSSKVRSPRSLRGRQTTWRDEHPHRVVLSCRCGWRRQGERRRGSRVLLALGASQATLMTLWELADQPPRDFWRSGSSTSPCSSSPSRRWAPIPRTPSRSIVRAARGALARRFDGSLGTGTASRPSLAALSLGFQTSPLKRPWPALISSRGAAASSARCSTTRSPVDSRRSRHR